MLLQVIPYAIQIGWKYTWVVPLGTTLRNEKGTKNDQIIFLGAFILNAFTIIN
jgi:hypothetical protein